MENKVRTVYILKCSDATFYVGCTKDLDHRFKEHCKGGVLSTRQRLPVEIWTFIVFNEKYKAYNFEKYLKSGSGRAFMNKRFV